MRVQRLLIDPCLLMNLTSGEFRVVAGAVPDDARLVETTIDPASGCVELCVESAQFDDVETGGLVPVMDSPIISRIDGTAGKA